MGLGSTARKLQGLTDTAEELYAKISEVLDRVRGIESSIEHTDERVEELNDRLDRQAAILEAIAEDHDIDIEAVTPEEEPATPTESESEA